MPSLKTTPPPSNSKSIGLELTVLGRSPATILRRAGELGLDRKVLERAAGLVEADLADPDVRVSKAKVLTLWREISERVGDPLFGLRLGASLRARELGLVGYVMAASENLGHALECLSRYGRILADDLQCTLQLGEETADYEVSAAVDLIALAHPVQARIAGVLAVSRELTGREICPVEVRLPLKRPMDARPYQEYFQSRVLFEASAAGLTFAAADLELPILNADLGLSKYLEDYARGLLEALPVPGSLVNQIWRILMVRLPAGDPGIEAVAETLGLNARTVQRRLKDEGTTYRDLRDFFRQTTAQKLLGNPRIPIKEISFLLGYQDLGAFYRAFRRWENCSPMEYRNTRAEQ
jgi:AraC-like DNA-binding protein